MTTMDMEQMPIRSTIIWVFVKLNMPHAKFYSMDLTLLMSNDDDLMKKNGVVDDQQLISKSKKYSMISLLFQIGLLLNVRPKDVPIFHDTMGLGHAWKLTRFTGGAMITDLKDIFDGDWLVLDINRYAKFLSDVSRDWYYQRKFWKQVPPKFKNIVTVSWAPIVHNNCDDVNKLSSNITYLQLNSEMSTENNTSVAIDIIDSDSDSGSSDDNICDTSSVVEDVTEIWQARRDEERRKMKDNAVAID